MFYLFLYFIRSGPTIHGKSVILATSLPPMILRWDETLYSIPHSHGSFGFSVVVVVVEVMGIIRTLSGLQKVVPPGTNQIKY